VWLRDLRMTDDRLIDGDEAGAVTGVKSRSRRYALIAQGRFPQPVKIGGSTRFSERECRAFVAERIAERDKGGAS
jgi:predicted DNA-binding transcriptional regulator AlpA